MTSATLFSLNLINLSYALLPAGGSFCAVGGGDGERGCESLPEGGQGAVRVHLIRQPAADTCLPAGRSVRGSDRPPACHSAPRTPQGEGKGDSAPAGAAGGQGRPPLQQSANAHRMAGRPVEPNAPTVAEGSGSEAVAERGRGAVLWTDNDEQ